MSKLQHTSGPWNNKNIEFFARDIIGICATFKDDKTEARANARLIAAAPEMLEALITTYKAFNTDGHEHDCGQPCEGCECFLSCPNITVKQAIEKATGMSIEEILK